MARDDSFTLVFKGDIRSFKMNPLKTETPFGVPYAAGVGNIFEAFDDLLDFAKWVAAQGGDNNQMKIFKLARAVIAKAEA